METYEAGREMDALVWLALNGKTAEMIDQGVRNCRYVDGDVQPHAGHPLGHISPPPYSTDIAAAQDVIKTVLASFAQPGSDGRFSGGDVRLRQHAARRGTEDVGYGNWGCMFTKRYSDKPKEWHGAGEDLPLAICRAALKVILNGNP